VGQPGHGLRRGRSVELGLRRLRGFVHQSSAAEGRGADEIAGFGAKDNLYAVAGFGEFAGDGGDRQGARRGSDGDQDQGNV